MIQLCAVGGCGNSTTRGEVLVTAWDGVTELEVPLCGDHADLRPHNSPLHRMKPGLWTRPTPLNLVAGPQTTPPRGVR